MTTLNDVYIGEPIPLGEVYSPILNQIFGPFASLHFIGSFIDGAGKQIIILELVDPTRGQVRQFYYNLGKLKANPSVACKLLGISFTFGGFLDRNTIITSTKSN